MAAPVEEVQQPPESLTGYGELKVAIKIVREVHKNKLKWLPDFFGAIPLYDGTPLAREGAKYVGENEVLMKNVYYLATKTPNMSAELVLTLVDEGVFTAEEGDLIMQQPTDKLRAVKMYALLVEKDDPVDEILISVMRALKNFQNNDVLKIFENHNIIHFVIQDDGTQQVEPRVVRVAENIHVPAENEDNVEVVGNQEVIGNEGWPCRFCTFINNAGTNICEVCSKSVDFTLDDSIDFHICPQCTLMNDREAEACDACGFQLRELAVVPAAAPPVDDSEDEEW